MNERDQYYIWFFNHTLRQLKTYFPNLFKENKTAFENSQQLIKMKKLIRICNKLLQLPVDF